MTSFSNWRDADAEELLDEVHVRCSPMNLPPGKEILRERAGAELAAEIVVGDLKAKAVGLASKNGALHLLLTDAIDEEGKRVSPAGVAAASDAGSAAGPPASRWACSRQGVCPKRQECARWRRVRRCSRCRH